MLRSPVGKLVYADSTIYKPPVILRSSNGWLYKPDDLRSADDIRLGRNRSFPRSDAEWSASEYVWGELKKHHEGRDYEKPVSASDIARYPSTGWGDELVAAFWDTTFGWVSMVLNIRKSKEDEYEFTYSLKGSVLLRWLAEREVSDRGGSADWSCDKTYSTTTSHVQAFIDDPYGVVTDLLDIPAFDGTRLLDPPDLSNMDYKRDRDFSDEENTFSSSKNNALFYKEGVIKEIFASESNWEILEEFFAALRYVGFSLKPTWTYGSRGYNDKSLSGLVISVPEQSNMHEHTVTINALNPHVTIDCGYMHDEHRWLDRKKREAVDQMAELEDVLRTFEIEIEL